MDLNLSLNPEFIQIGDLNQLVFNQRYQIITQLRIRMSFNSKKIFELMVMLPNVLKLQ